MEISFYITPFEMFESKTLDGQYDTLICLVRLQKGEANSFGQAQRKRVSSFFPSPTTALLIPDISQGMTSYRVNVFVLAASRYSNVLNGGNTAYIGF